MSYKGGIVYFNVSGPLYEKYQELESPIIKATAKRLRLSGVNWIYLEFQQEDGTEMESFSYELNFSKKNVEQEVYNPRKAVIRIRYKNGRNQ